jgi:foldase protein PrsA
MPKKKNRSVKKNNIMRKEVKEEIMMDQDELSTETTAKPRSFKLLYVGAVVLLVGAIIFLGAKKYGNFFIAASVNGKPIVRFSLWQRLEKRFGTQVIDEMVNEEIIREEMQKKGLAVAAKDVDQRIKDLETRFKGKAALDQMLTAQGMTREDLKTQLELQIAIEKLVPAQKVTDQEVQMTYDASPEQYGEELTNIVKQQIKDQLLQQKTSKAFSDWFEKVKKQVKVIKY